MYLNGKRAINFALRIFIPSFFIFSVIAVLAQQNPDEQLTFKERISYTQLMREVRERKSSSERIEKFIKQQEVKLGDLGISGKKKRRYFELLDRQLEKINKDHANLSEPAAQTQTQAEPRFKLPERPGRFHFSKDPQVIRKLNKAKIFPKRGQKISNLLKKLVAIEPANAVEDQFLPTIDDVRQDNGEIMITTEMKDIAADLQRNPVKIFNFVRNNITYEPYYGAKKGSIGCLREKVCNDTDASSLLVALLRAAGIPARYEKSAAVFTVQQLQNLLGVDQTKTAYAAFSNNEVPVFVLSDALDGVSFEQADFSAETHLVLEWTHVETFYEYDERGGNISNTLDLSGAASTDEVKDALREFPKKQWVPIDPIIKPYTRTLKPILADLANFDTENFWYEFFEYQGAESPLGKYRADLTAATGQQIVDNLSTKSSPKKDLSILPITLPYFIGTGQTDETEITLERFSILPDLRRQKVSIALKRDSNDEIVLSHTFFGSEINNGRIDLLYEGLTDTDKAVIAEYGGIHSTPAALVDIAPYLQIENSRYEGDATAANSRPPVEIGETLVLQFEYFVSDESVYDDQKFSIAGNNEGIFITLSQIASDGLLDDTNDENRNSHILLEGNAALAREYMRQIQEDGATIKQSLDYEYNLQFGRAVVTQNRILTEVDGAPTTFDFKGLSLDAAVYIADYSNRGQYNNHRKDFRLLWGQQASYMEGELFETVASLDSISTVKGLQFAHANPATYAVQTITSANESVIDQLQLSENTKQNMHTDVQAGNTIITPDKAVENQAWRGIFYVSLRPDWTALYAIGEQTGNNGGFTVVTIEVESYCDTICVNTYYTFDGARRFLEQEQPYLSVRCTISETTYLEITNNQNVPADAPIYERWKEEYGSPCFRETKTFGTVNYTFIVATRGAKFYAQQIPLGQSQPTGLHNYWVKHDVAKQTVFQNVQNPDETKFRFNIIAGTYSYNTSSYAVYYEPVQPTALPDGESWLEKGRSWSVTGAILSKLQEPSYKKEASWCPPNDSYCSNIAYKRNWVINKIGYPIGAQATAAESYPYGTEGSYQNFIGGQIYYETTWINNAYYVPGYIEKEYNRPLYCQTDYGCGTGGELGFPVNDPLYSETQNMIFQDFENGTRIKDFMSRPVPDRIETAENVQTIPIIRNYTDSAYHDEFIEGIMDAFAEFDVYGVSINFAAGLSVPFVINAFKGHIVKKLGKTALFKVGFRYVPLVGWAFSGVTAALAIDANWPLYKACETDPDIEPLIDGKSPAYYCGKLIVNGIAFGLGAATTTGASKLINKFGVSKLIAVEGKYRFFQRVKDPQKWTKIKVAIVGNPNMKDSFFEITYRLDNEDLNFLADRDFIVERLLTSQPKYTITFNGFVKNGQFWDNVKYRVDPYFKTEFDDYPKLRAFHHQKMINAGITKGDFYLIDELEEALDIYRQNNFDEIVETINPKDEIVMKSKGEIIFVKKTDGTTIISPRRNKPWDILPHPYLSKGEDVIAAGTIKPGSTPGSLIVTNSTGHFKVHKDDIESIINELESLGYVVKFEQAIN